MCGIGGFYDFESNGFTSKNIFLLLDSLKKRGPEGTSWLEIDYENNYKWIVEKEKNYPKNLKFAMGCSRLAINDKSSRGLQPLSNNQGYIWVSLNGEIFNFIEIKKELASLGFIFKTDTDTEVIVYAYEKWGIDCLKKFNGQFAISIFDRLKNKIILCRDRLGIVPLYYFFDKKKLFFATEINSILRSINIKLSINERKASAIIGLPYKLHDFHNHTLIKEIKCVSPSEIIEINLTKKEMFKKIYWNPSDIEKDRKINYLGLKDQLRYLLEDSVKIRLRTDRKLAFIISGGVDSPSVLGIAKKKFNIQTDTFSLDLPDKRFNENKAIEEVLSNLSIKNNFLKVNEDIFIENLYEVINNMDQPLSTPNAVLHNYMAKEIEKSGNKVVLNGVGGDEVFFGYHDHFLYFLNYLKKENRDRFIYEKNIWIKDHNRSEKLFTDFSNFIFKETNYSPDFLARSRGYDYRCLIKDQDIIKNYLVSNLEFDVKEKQIFDLTKSTLPHSIKMDDNCYFSNAIEARQPFLDYRIVELGLKIPEKFLVNKGFSKFILRQSMKAYIPKSIRLNKKKIGLNLPIDKWMNLKVSRWITKNLNNKNNLIFDYSCYDSIQKIVDEHKKKKNNHNLKIWDLCLLNEWLQKNKLFLN